jgi:hypothetical protein
MIGDPTGKSTDRPMLTRDEIAANTAGIQRCLEGLIRFSGDSNGPAAVCVNNLGFYENLSVLSFMRDVGVHFRVSAMLNKDSVKARLSPTVPSADQKPEHSESLPVAVGGACRPIETSTREGGGSNESSACLARADSGARLGTPSAQPGALAAPPPVVKSSSAASGAPAPGLSFCEFSYQASVYLLSCPSSCHYYCCCCCD